MKLIEQVLRKNGVIFDVLRDFEIGVTETTIMFLFGNAVIKKSHNLIIYIHATSAINFNKIFETVFKI